MDSHKSRNIQNVMYRDGENLSVNGHILKLFPIVTCLATQKNHVVWNFFMVHHHFKVIQTTFQIKQLRLNSHSFLSTQDLSLQHRSCHRLIYSFSQFVWWILFPMMKKKLSSRLMALHLISMSRAYFKQSIISIGTFVFQILMNHQHNIKW